MRRLCCSRWLVAWAVVAAALWGGEKSAVFYYGEDISWPMVGAYDYIVVEPDHIDTATHGFRRYVDKIYAYVSVGETAKKRWYAKRIEKTWKKGENKTWQSDVMDLSNAEYRTFLIDSVVARLYRRGFRNFFLDTLDAYRAHVKNPRERHAQRQGLITLIETLHRRYPKAKLILNRGFEIFDAVKDMVEAVAFESYYAGLDAKGRYRAVSDADRRWLDRKLAAVKRAGKPIIAIDYLPDAWGKEAVSLARKLRAEGFVPYVATRALDRYGTTDKPILKREILLIYDDIHRYGVQFSAAHMYASMPLEYMGYVPVLRHVDTIDWQRDVFDRYAGIVVWLEAPYKHHRRLFEWVKRQARHGVHTLFMGTFAQGEDGTSLRTLGIDVATYDVDPRSCRFEHKASFADFEVPIDIQETSMLYRPKEATAWVRYRCGSKRSVIAAKTPWGGYALEEASLVEFGEDNLWSLDPFTLFREALRLTPPFALDPTTQSGRRLMFAHIDGDGIMNVAAFDPKRVSGEVIYDEILKRFRIPHSVSLVGAEVMPEGIYPELSPRLESVARNIYALPLTEVATHTFSHPFEWNKITPEGDLSPEYRLDVPGYDFNLSFELEGTLEYFETHYASAATRKPRIVFWSGDCMPPASVLSHTYRHGLLNLNGGDTTVTNDRPWLYNIAPFGIAKEGYYQIYTGQQNENVYTNEFTGPLWGYAKAIQTFERTDMPRRFKPIDIYYHFYSGSKLASLKALKKVYNWALHQATMPIFASQYVQKVLEFYDASVMKTSNCFRIDGVGALRNVRLSPQGGTIDWKRSDGVIGIHEAENGRFVTFSQKKRVRLCLRPDASQEVPYLVEANGVVDTTHRAGEYRIRSYVAHESVWHVPSECRLRAFPPADINVREGKRIRLRHYEVREVRIDVTCP